MEGMEQGGSAFGGIIAIIILVIFIVAWWKIFTKAGQPRLGKYYSDLQYLYLDENCRKTRLVGNLDVYSFCESGCLYFSDCRPCP